jgi:hypothetical protein
MSNKYKTVKVVDYIHNMPDNIQKVWAKHLMDTEGDICTMHYGWKIGEHVDENEEYDDVSEAKILDAWLLSIGLTVDDDILINVWW